MEFETSRFDMVWRSDIFHINIFDISVSIQGSEPILRKGMSNTKQILRRLLYRVFDCLIFRSI